MSSRALRRLRPDIDLSQGEPIEDVPVMKLKSKKKNKNLPTNPFDLLEDAVDADNSLIDDNDSDQEKKIVAEDAEKNMPANKVKKKNKKKKKKLIEEGSKQECKKEGEDDIEASVREVNQILGELPSRVEVGNTEPWDATNSYTHRLLNIEHKHLDPNQEMRKIFGSRVVQTETRQSRRRGRKAGKTYWLVKPKENWPRSTRLGLKMNYLGSKGKEQNFAFEHSKEYREVQFQFLDAVESLNPQNIVNVLNLNPSHIDSLLQLSEVCKMSEDMQMAAELIERALFTFEQNFHPMFNLALGTCRLDYCQPENRAFYLAIFRHLQFVGQRGCYRTSLEFCKLLLSLDPEGDPLCALLMIDFYALRCEQYNFLIRLFSDWEGERNLFLLPNFAFSVPLAMFFEAKNEKTETSNADNLLQQGLLMFPGVLMPLLDKCGVTPDKQVAAHSFFSSQKQLQQPDALKQLISLFVGRCHSCWKETEVIVWLERNVRETLVRVENQDPLIQQFQERQKHCYKGMPRNIHRHIIMSEIKDATATLPPELSLSPVMSYDPLPPSDSIISYSRPHRPRRVEQDSNALSLFFRSLLPNYDPQEVVDNFPAGGAAGGRPPQDLQQGIGALMDAMRHLLNNIQPLPAPAAVQENENNQDNGEERPPEEWD